MRLLALIALAGAGPAKAIDLNSCGVLNQAGATYNLKNDVTSPGSCFSIQADDITLDLGGFTVSYGADPNRTLKSFGVMAIACWSPGLDSNPCGGSAANLVVRNGRIVEHPNSAGSHNHGIRMGQTNNSHNPTLRNLHVEVHSPASINANFQYIEGVNVHDNTFVSKVTKIFNRHQLEGALVKVSGAKGPSTVRDNVLIGGAQTGITVWGAGSKIYNNDISQEARYTNGFAIFADSPGIEIYGNTVHPKSGRGIRASADGIVVRNNDVTVIENAVNAEYGGCQGGGVYGIQLEHATNVEVHGNTVRAIAADCDASALKLTAIDDGANNRVYNNLLIGEKRPGGGMAFGVTLSFSKNGISIENNKIEADSALIQIDWSGSRQARFHGNTFSPHRPGARPLMWRVVPGGNDLPSIGNQLVDSLFQGVRSDTFHSKNEGFGNWAVRWETEEVWTLGVRAEDGSGLPVADADITLSDASGNTIVSGKTNAAGMWAAEVPSVRYSNSTTQNLIVSNLGPHTLSVSKGGFGGQSRQIVLDARKGFRLDMAGGLWVVDNSVLPSPAGSIPQAQPPLPLPPAPQPQPEPESAPQPQILDRPPSAPTGFRLGIARVDLNLDESD